MGKADGQLREGEPWKQQPSSPPLGAWPPKPQYQARCTDCRELTETAEPQRCPVGATLTALELRALVARTGRSLIPFDLIEVADQVNPSGRQTSGGGVFACCAESLTEASKDRFP